MPYTEHLIALICPLTGQQATFKTCQPSPRILLTQKDLVMTQVNKLLAIRVFSMHGPVRGVGGNHIRVGGGVLCVRLVGMCNGGLAP